MEKKKFVFDDKQVEAHHYRLVNAVLSSRDEILKEIKELRKEVEELKK